MRANCTRASIRHRDPDDTHLFVFSVASDEQFTSRSAPRAAQDKIYQPDARSLSSPIKTARFPDASIIFVENRWTIGSVEELFLLDHRVRHYLSQAHLDLIISRCVGGTLYKKTWPGRTVI